jgi:hypothetical protein
MALHKEKFQLAGKWRDGGASNSLHELTANEVSV